jgi:hypothetical protein
MTVAEKDAQINAVASRAESLASQLADAESSAQALQSNVSRLNTALAISDEEIGVQKDKVSVN